MQTIVRSLLKEHQPNARAFGACGEIMTHNMDHAGCVTPNAIRGTGTEVGSSSYYCTRATSESDPTHPSGWRCGQSELEFLQLDSRWWAPAVPAIRVGHDIATR